MSHFCLAAWQFEIRPARPTGSLGRLPRINGSPSFAVTLSKSHDVHDHTGLSKLSRYSLIFERYSMPRLQDSALEHSSPVATIGAGTSSLFRQGLAVVCLVGCRERRRDQISSAKHSRGRGQGCERDRDVWQIHPSAVDRGLYRETRPPPVQCPRLHARPVTKGIRLGKRRAKNVRGSNCSKSWVDCEPHEGAIMRGDRWSRPFSPYPDSP